MEKNSKIETTDAPAVAAIPRLFRSKWYQHYSASKLKRDPVYEAVFSELEGTKSPVMDVGCGLGLFAFFLRSRGLAVPILGVDYDAKKIAAAQKIAAMHYSAMEFRVVDAREGVPDHCGNVTILDILQFFKQPERERLLRAAAASVAEGERFLIRSGVADDSKRFRHTRWGDWAAKLTFWMPAAPVDYPTREEIHTVLESAGLEGGSEPLWGNTPFNNYLFSYRRR